jgi:hypothetical protein
LVRAIVGGDAANVSRLLAASPGLVNARAEQRGWLGQIEHYLYVSDTALHIAGARYRDDLARKLVRVGADLSAPNRRWAPPLDYAADGIVRMVEQRGATR